MNKYIRFFWRFFPGSVRRQIHDNVIVRLIQSYIYRKESFTLRSSTNVFTDVAKTNYWSSQESMSGGGSTMAATEVIRSSIPTVIKNYQIRSMLDAPCGDYNWMKTVPKNCTYIGGDIVREIVDKNQKLYSSDTVQFKLIDITRDDLPSVDLIFSKDFLQHLSYCKIADALLNFKRSGANFLWVTSYPNTWRNHDIYDGDYRPLNLQKKPFCLPEPLLKVKEKPSGPNVETDKTMCLYEIKKLPLKFNIG